MPDFVPGLAGIPAAESRICFIDGQKGVLEYRGLPIEVLAERTSFEETTLLLIRGRLPAEAELRAFKRDLARHRRLKYRIVDLLKCLPESGHPMDALGSSVAAMGMFYPSKEVQDAEVQSQAALRLIAKLPTLVAAYHRLRRGDEALAPRDDLEHAANFLWLLHGDDPDPFVARVLDVCLILHAEHSMNASTFSARVTGSTLADPYSVISAAVSTLAGPLHGGANEDVVGMLREIGSVGNVRPYIEKHIRENRKIAGFGHRVYKVKDPRAGILEKMAVGVCDRLGGTVLYDIARETEKVVTEHLGPKGIYPNVDFYSGIVYDRMGIPTDLFTPIFAIARVAGWLAHWIEQLANNRIFRPGQSYIGERSKEFTPIERR
jgi:2-methylcitrate synthase